MQYQFFSRVVLSVVICSLLPANHVPADPASGSFKPMLFLLGHCWAGTLPNGQLDTHCFDWLYPDKVIRDQHIVGAGESAYRGLTLYTWNSESVQLDYTYYNSDGGLSRGIVNSGDSGELLFPEQHEDFASVILVPKQLWAAILHW